MKNQQDIELYDAILKVVNNNQVNTDNFLNDYQNKDYNKNGRQEFWASMGTYSSAATQQRIEEINNNPNYQPSFNRGNYGSSYENSNPGEFDENIKNQSDANKILEILIPQLYKYDSGVKSLINDINQNTIKLGKLVKKLNEKTAYLFPESIISRQKLLLDLDSFIKAEKKKENKKILNNLKDLFVESFL